MQAFQINPTLVCVALNDQRHLQLMESHLCEPPYQQPPTQPVLYFKPRNTLNQHWAIVEWPDHSSELVVGASMVLVLGKETCRVTPEDAMDYVSGLTIVHDFSLPEESYYRPDIKGKCLDGSAPVADINLNAELVSEMEQLEVVTDIDGTIAQRLPVSALLRSPAELISAISYIMTLQPGDMIAVGFPAERTPVERGNRVTSRLQHIGEDRSSPLCELINPVEG